MKRYAFCLLMLATGLSHANEDRFADVQIKRTPLNKSVYMLTGWGGNIGVSAGEDGILIVDDQFEPLAEKIAASLKDVNPSGVKFIVNTHYHGDHTGSNAWFKKVQGATAFAHDNVRVRMGLDEKNSHDHLPVVTYNQGLTFHFNGETIRVLHMADGHTDGDSVLFFDEADVLHAGDLFFNQLFPYIDLSGGGTVKGYIANIEKLLTMVGPHTKIIPGHGPLANKADLQTVLTMLRETSSRIGQLKYKEGKSLEEAITAGVQEKWKGWSWNFIDEKKWITTLYLGL